MTAPVSVGNEGSTLVSFVVSNDLEITLHVAALPVLILAVVGLALWLGFRWWAARRFPDFEIDATEFGFGDQKISLRPNNMDRQIAYSIWVELSTRKVGLPIELDDDVIAEIYDSWYAFFGVTRELIKDIPVSKVRNDSTGKIINLSIEVLNEGLRPHLTKWQARFRHWYGAQMETKPDASPQDVQKRFPEYEALSTEMLEVNQRLRNYRKRMYELVTDKRETKRD